MSRAWWTVYGVVRLCVRAFREGYRWQMSRAADSGR